jgi:tryptophan synthase beta chain
MTRRPVRHVRRALCPRGPHPGAGATRRGPPARPPVDPEFLAELDRLHRTYTGRPEHHHRGAALRRARRRRRVILKREDLNHTGSHKINNVLGQALLTKRMGKRRVIAETGAGQHGVATATAAALLGLECTIYMGKVDTERQALNVARMRCSAPRSSPSSTAAHPQGRHQRGAARLGDQCRRHALRCIGTVTGPHPFPEMVRDFHRIIGVEARAQVLDLTGRLPDAVIACVGGGSNAMGIFHRFIDDAEVRLDRGRGRGRGHRVRAARGPLRRAAARRAPRRDELPAAGRGRPDHRVAFRSRRAWTTRASVPSTPTCATSGGPSTATPPTSEAMEAFRLLCRTEGIIPALESAHALAGCHRGRPRTRARTR